MWWTDLRQARSLWAGVALVLAAVQTFCVLSALIVASGLAVAGSGDAERREGAYELMSVVGGGSVGAVLVCTMAVGGAVMQRRGQIARWALAGALPRQIVRMVLIQVLGVTAVASVPAAALAGLVAVFAVLPVLTARGPDEVVMAPLVVVVLAARLVAAAAPALLPATVRAWTHLVPTRSPAWTIAHDTAVDRTARSVGTVIPIALMIGIPAGLIAVSRTLIDTIAAARPDLDVGSGTNVSDVIIMFAPAFVIPITGVVGGLLVAARQRTLDLALVAIAGASPAQTWWQTVYEGLIVARQTSWQDD